MNTQKRFQKLIYDACVIYGNCGTGDTHIWDFIPKTGSLTAEEFAHLMLKAEKEAPPPYGKRNQRNFEWCVDRFRQTMGAEIVDVSERSD